jgi:transcriptional regulator with XRE-family HTH domain
MDHDPPAEIDSTPGYSRVGPEKAAEIVRLRRIRPNITQSEIAAALGIAVSTVSRWLAALENDTVKEARQLAKSQSLRATMRIDKLVDADDPRVALGAAKAITALAGVQEGTAQVAVGVQVIVGSSSQPAGPDPFDNVDGIILDKSTG